MAFILVETDTIETLTLYDAEENERGIAERRDDAGNWYCEYRDGDAVTTFQAADYQAALGYLRTKRDAFLPGGFVLAISEFRIDPAPEVGFSEDHPLVRAARFGYSRAKDLDECRFYVDMLKEAGVPIGE
jgi:hypothetical protein